MSGFLSIAGRLGKLLLLAVRASFSVCDNLFLADACLVMVRGIVEELLKRPSRSRAIDWL